MFENFRPGGYWTGYSWIGFLPDGDEMRFTSEDEYLEYLSDVWGR